MSDDLNATHSRWLNGILAHQIVDARHIPGWINLVEDGLSQKDKGLLYEEDDRSSWLVVPDWEEARGLHYDLFSVNEVVSTLHSDLHNQFKNKPIFLEAIDALLGITAASTKRECK